MNALLNGAKGTKAMSKINDDNLDPIVAAALMDDPTDDEDELKLKKEALSLEDNEKEEEEAEEDNEQDKEPIEESEEESQDEGESEELKQKEEPEEELKEQKSRKERRAERKAAFLESIKREQPQNKTQELFQSDPNYQPLNYEQQEEFKADELVQDREQYGKQELAKGAQLGEYYATQTHFWDTVELENKVLSHDPKYSFLFETLPDGQPNPDFDSDMAGDINELYLELVGFDPDKKTVKRTDLSYEKFVKREVQRIEDRVEERLAEAQKNIVSQQSKAGIRPTGTAKKSLGKLRPGSISSMSDEDFEKNEADIDRQINEMLGI
mgnify:CR=1 FL=1